MPRWTRCAPWARRWRNDRRYVPAPPPAAARADAAAAAGRTLRGRCAEQLSTIEQLKSAPTGRFSDCQKTCPVTSIGGKDTIDWQGQTRLTACLSGAFCSFRLGLRQQACGSKTKNHSKIHRWQVRSSFAGAEMCPDKKRPAENTCRIVKGLDAVWAHFCPSKPCLPLSIDGILMVTQRKMVVNTRRVWYNKRNGEEARLWKRISPCA